MSSKKQASTDITARPVFSIIMNVYNGEAYLREAIDSVLVQTFSNWELIIWDDFSSDGSAHICREYDDPRVRYFLSPEHAQIGKARNLAIRQAQCEWLAFLDQDDIWMPNKLFDQNHLIEINHGNKFGFVYGRTIQFDVDGNLQDFDRWHEFSALPDGDIYKVLINRPSFVCLSSAVLLKRAIEEFGGIPDMINYCPDYYLFVMVAKNYGAACLQDVCCWYRKHPSNMTATYKIQIYCEALFIINLQGSFIDRAVIARRGKVYNSLIGMNEIVSGISIIKGIMRIIKDGSIAYLAFQPFLYSSRKIRRLCRKITGRSLITASRTAKPRRGYSV